MVRPAGVEPTTLGFGNQYSIQLSYGRNLAIIANKSCSLDDQRYQIFKSVAVLSCLPGLEACFLYRGFCVIIAQVIHTQWGKKTCRETNNLQVSRN